MDHFRNEEGRVICDKIAGKFYLTREQYIAQRQVWCKQDCWEAMATQWSSSRFKNRSEVNRANRSSRKFKTHKGGSSSIAVIRQRLSKKLGREVTDIEAWVHTHRGENPEDTTTLNTEEAIACLEKYKSKAMELNGPNFDWLHSPVDVRALYQCTCGRPHGKWATFNGIVNDREARAELKRSRASSAAAKRQRQEEENRIRKEAHDCSMAKEYAQNMLQWGTIVQAQYDHIQSFMETVALHNGMPATSVPPPLPVPPQPPTYGVLPSRNPSPENAATFGSSIRGETPDEILSRIAYGGFGVQVNAANGGCNSSPMNATNSNGDGGGAGFVNAATSGGGNYSPPEYDEFPLD
ncbi:unnamed protein product [Urochloa humidicola]